MPRFKNTFLELPTYSVQSDHEIGTIYTYTNTWALYFILQPTSWDYMSIHHVLPTNNIPCCFFTFHIGGHYTLPMIYYHMIWCPYTKSHICMTFKAEICSTWRTLSHPHGHQSFLISTMYCGWKLFSRKNAYLPCFGLYGQSHPHPPLFNTNLYHS